MAKLIEELMVLGINYNTTTNSIACLKNFNDKPELWTDHVFEDENKYEVVKQSGSHPLRTIYDNKRFIGRYYYDVRDILQDYPFNVIDRNGIIVYELTVKNNEKKYKTPFQVSVDLFKYLRKVIKSHVDDTNKIKKICIIYPAYFTTKQKHDTIHSGIFGVFIIIFVCNNCFLLFLTYYFCMC